MEFWDWYHRRLVKDPGFRRDFPAQKSFSKLRAAIAGLYAKTGHFREAGDAFREATLLYPASPEASFRYIQEVLLPMRRWTQIEDIMDFTDRVDPNNSRTAGMRDYVQRLRQVTEDISRLQQKAASGKLTPGESIHLAQCYLSLGHAQMAAQTLRKLLEKPEVNGNFEILFRCAQLMAQSGQRGDAAQTAKKAAAVVPGNLDPAFLRELAQILLEGGLVVEADQQMNAYLRVRGRDADAWMQLAIIKDAVGDAYAAQNAIRQAYQIDPNVAQDKLRSSEKLQRIAAPLFRRRMPQQ